MFQDKYSKKLVNINLGFTFMTQYSHLTIWNQRTCRGNPFHKEYHNSLYCILCTEVKWYWINLFLLECERVMTFSDFEINQLSKHNKNCLIVWLTTVIMYVFNGIINIIEVEINIIKIAIFNVWVA